MSNFDNNYDYEGNPLTEIPSESQYQIESDMSLAIEIHNRLVNGLISPEDAVILMERLREKVNDLDSYLILKDFLKSIGYFIDEDTGKVVNFVGDITYYKYSFKDNTSNSN